MNAPFLYGQARCGFRSHEATEKDFWARTIKGAESECWLWRGAKNNKGYGRFTWPPDRKDGYAHRYSWILHFGPIPPKMHVLHRCDNPLCVNPVHLWLGTNLDNIRDRQAKGRSRLGSNHPTSKLNEKQVAEIRQKYIPHKYHMYMLAKEYGVTPSAICHILNRKIWRHLA